MVLAPLEHVGRGEMAHREYADSYGDSHSEFVHGDADLVEEEKLEVD